MLHEDTVDEEITELTSSIRILYQLQGIGTSMRQIDATVTTKHSSRLMSSLVRIQSNANRLYHAISLGWAPGCHSTHKARLMLEDRIEQPASTTRAKWSNKPLDFKIIFALEYSTACDLLWHEGNVKVVEDGPGMTSRASQVSTHPLSLSSISTTTPSARTTGSELFSIHQHHHPPDRPLNNKRPLPQTSPETPPLPRFDPCIHPYTTQRDAVAR